MYDDHYGFTARPFQLTPDPRFWYESATHRKAMAYLGYGLSQGEGFIVVTGDIGAGKTTLVGHLMATIDREHLHIIKLASTQIDADDLLRLVATGLEVDCTGLSKAQMLDQVERALHAVARSGRRTLLIVDEAQALAISALEELRMLSNFQAGGHALLQIFLLGQPEFRDRLQGSARLEQLRQRVIAIHHLDPMGRNEVEPYIAHRLGVVGWSGRPRFSPDAFDALYDGSGGVPRLLNILAGRVLLFGAIEQFDVIDATAVDAVLADMAGDYQSAAANAGAAPAPLAENDDKVAGAPIWLGDDATAMAPPIGAAFAMTVAPGGEVAVPVAGADVAAWQARVAGLEARVEEQEAALRRVLTLLVDWVEGDSQRPDLSSFTGSAA